MKIESPPLYPKPEVFAKEAFLIPTEEAVRDKQSTFTANPIFYSTADFSAYYLLPCGCNIKINIQDLKNESWVLYNCPMCEGKNFPKKAVVQLIPPAFISKGYNIRKLSRGERIIRVSPTFPHRLESNTTSKSKFAAWRLSLSDRKTNEATKDKERRKYTPISEIYRIFR